MYVYSRLHLICNNICVSPLSEVSICSSALNYTPVYDTDRNSSVVKDSAASPDAFTLPKIIHSNKESAIKAQGENNTAHIHRYKNITLSDKERYL